MGQLDDFIHAQCAAQLVEGEQIQGTAFLRQPAKGSINVFGVVGEYGNVWLAAGTNQRLILMLTEASGLMKTKPKPMCKQVIVWQYKDLKSVTVDRCKGLGADGVWFWLEPHESQGPNQGKGARYDVSPQAQGVDWQGQFFSQFPSWLQRQVAAGAFLNPQQQAAFAQQPHSFQPGTQVVVVAPDGNRYPATIAQAAQGQYLCTMPDGQSYWFPQQSVGPA